MPSGGARARSGPPPDPNALRRRQHNAGEWWTLPADGRAGDPPKWPLTRAKKRELDVWADLWAKPQAVAWEQLGQDYEVAMYVRRLVQAETPYAPPALGTLVRQLGEALGLTIPGMARNRWKIGTIEPERVEPAKPIRSWRDRVVVVDGGGAA